MKQKIYFLALMLFLSVNETLSYSMVVYNCDALDNTSLDWKFELDNQVAYGDHSNGRAIPAGWGYNTIYPTIAPDPTSGNYDKMYFAVPSDITWTENSSAQAPKDGGNLYVKQTCDGYVTSLDGCPSSSTKNCGTIGSNIHKKLKLHKKDLASPTTETIKN